MKPFFAIPIAIGKKFNFKLQTLGTYNCSTFLGVMSSTEQFNPSSLILCLPFLAS
jgi:hypothetical protein